MSGESPVTLAFRFVIVICDCVVLYRVSPEAPRLHLIVVFVRQENWTVDQGIFDAGQMRNGIYFQEFITNCLCYDSVVASEFICLIKRKREGQTKAAIQKNGEFELLQS